jgi:hypothetical protein
MPDPAILQAAFVVVLLWLVVDRGPAFLHATTDLGISFFRPWRGDPWPRGVQEDDDFRFDWRPARRVPDHAETEDLVEAGVALARPDHVDVHRAGR